MKIVFFCYRALPEIKLAFWNTRFFSSFFSGCPPTVCGFGHCQFTVIKNQEWIIPQREQEMKHYNPTMEYSLPSQIIVEFVLSEDPRSPTPPWNPPRVCRLLRLVLKYSMHRGEIVFPQGLQEHCYLLVTRTTSWIVVIYHYNEAHCVGLYFARPDKERKLKVPSVCFHIFSKEIFMHVRYLG